MNKKMVRLALFLLVGSASADEIGLKTAVYDWPNDVPYTLTVQPPSGNPRHLLYHLFHPTEDPLATTLYPDFSVGNTSPTERSMQLGTRNLLSTQATDPFRAYRDDVLMEKLGGRFTILDHKRLLVLRELAAIPEEAISWSVEDGAQLLPGEQPAVTLTNLGLPEETALVDDANQRTVGAVEPLIEVVRLGRLMPGGAVERDGGIYQGGAVPVILVQPGDSGRLQQSYLPTKSSLDPHLGDQLRPGRLTQIGFYEMRVLGLGGAIMAQRKYSKGHSSLDGALSLEPGGDGTYDSPPAIAVTLPDTSQSSDQARNLSLWVQRVLGDQTYGHAFESQGGVIASYPGFDGNNNRTLFPQKGDWRPGTYRAVLVWRGGVLADEIRFEIKQPGKRSPYWSVSLEPPLQPEDVLVELRTDDVQVRGPHIGFDVLAAKNRRPLETGPLIAELYRLGHFTYHCQWLEGYYTGGSGLVSSKGYGQVPSPVEAGAYELRVFRPMAVSTNAGAHEEYVGVQFSSPGSSASGNNMELIGVARFDVRAGRYDGMIQVEPFDQGDYGRVLNVSIRSPSPALKGHSLRLEAWHGAEQVPGGFQRHQYQDERSGGIAFDDGRGGVDSMAIDRFPFAASLLPIETPGNYELRIFDATTGLYIARQQMAFRDPGPPAMPEQAAYGEGLYGDWPVEDDPRRGLSAWYKPHSECADPEFDKPPKLEIVQYLVNDSDDTQDDEYRVAATVWAGHPYFVQATFDQAPPDDEYLVRVDGEKRISVSRSTDDPKLYRSAVLYFSEQSDE